MSRNRAYLKMHEKEQAVLSQGIEHLVLLLQGKPDKKRRYRKDARRYSHTLNQDNVKSFKGSTEHGISPPKL